MDPPDPRTSRAWIAGPRDVDPVLAASTDHEHADEVRVLLWDRDNHQTAWIAYDGYLLGLDEYR